MAAAGRSREERWSLAGAAALVTGGSKGIGHAIVEELAGFGARVHTCSRNATELEECRRRWEEKGLPVTVSVCDVSVRAEREKLVETVKETFEGKLDILVNNAGHSFSKTALECTAEDYSNPMATNLESSFHLSQLVHPLLINASIAGGSAPAVIFEKKSIAGGGSIINISSIGGSIAYPGLALYATTKVRAVPPPKPLRRWTPRAVPPPKPPRRLPKPPPCLLPTTPPLRLQMPHHLSTRRGGMNQLTRSLALSGSMTRSV